MRSKKEGTRLRGRIHIRKKHVAIVLAILAVAGGCVFGGRKIYQHFHGGVVSVYAVSDVGESSAWIDGNSSMSATVSTDQLQTEYVSESQTVDEIFVTKGQTVKVGDKLFSYDSTLEELDLKRSNINIQQKQLELDQAQKELAVMQTYRAGVPIPGSQSSSSGSTQTTSAGSSGSQTGGTQESTIPTYKGLKLLGGEGTEDSPYQYKWSSSFRFTKSFIAAATRGENEAYVQFLLCGDEVSGGTGTTDDGTDEDSDPADDTENPSDTGDSEQEEPTDSADNTDQTVIVEDPEDSDDADTDSEEEQEGDSQGQDNDDVSMDQVTKPDGEYSASWTMQFQKTSSSYRYLMLSMTVGGVERVISEPMDPLPKDDQPDQPNDDSDDDPDDPDVDNGTVYTQAEINEMLADQKQQIKDLQLEIRQAKIDYQKQEKELENSVVYSTVNGVVTKLRTPQQAGTSKPLVKIAGSNAGYFITSAVHELERDTVQQGQQVIVTNEDSGETYDGVVQSVSNYPAQDSSWYYDYESNPTASYYPFYVKVSGNADFDMDSYITLRLTDDQESDSSYYLMTAFVRSENGQSYVYVAGEDGKLEKRTVTTGKSLWGSYIEIKNGGISEDERIAFPYGKNVHEGAATQDASVDDLYYY
ncbi:MAG: hypothetical protein ACI4PM_04180 [Butyricicoccus sp.]